MESITTIQDNHLIARNKLRQSNIELLRIIAMAMVLVVHADFWSLGAPTIEDFESNSWGYTFRHIFEALCIGCVNIFVLISGYFGIRPKVKSFSSFLFQCLFFLISIYVIAICIGLSDLSVKGIMECFCLTPVNWFIKAYIGLYLISPILNAFVENADRKQFRNVLIGFYVFQSIWGLTGAASFFDGGYSTLSFMGLYLLARYIKLYPSPVCDKPRGYYLAAYLLSSAVLCVLNFAPVFIGRDLPWVSAYNYINPLVIVASVALLVYFSKLDIQSKVINWVAASSFAVFLLHSNPNLNVKVFLKTCTEIFHNTDGIRCLVYMGLFLLLVYIVAILYDQIRIVIWRLLSKRMFK